MKSNSVSRRQFIELGLGAAVASALPAAVWAANASAARAGYPANYGEIIAAAKREGKLVILGSTDRLAAEPLVKAFEATYPGISVTYSDLNTKELDRRYRAESEGPAVTDIVWSSAMDTQIALVQDGLAQVYQSPEKRFIPSWAEWRGLAYAATYEPVVFGFNRQHFPEAENATSHAAFAELLEQNAERLKGKVATLDVGKSALALMLEAQDQLADPAHDRVLRALGAARLTTQANNNDMLKGLASGDIWLGYNMLGSYLEVFARKNPQVGYVIPRDYSLVVSRVMLMAARAPHPNAAKLWIDYLLSAAGQTVMATACGLGAVREDVDGPFTLHNLRQIPGLRLRPLGVSARLLDHLDPLRRTALTERWHQRVGL